MSRWVMACVVAGALAASCKGEQAKEPERAPAVVTAVERAPLVAGYEALRDRFANDDLAGAKAAAEALVKIGGASGAAAVGEAARQVAAAADIEAARRAFGELSKAYLTVLQKKPELAEGLHAFRCPMAEGYQKWVQVDAELKNPYMGKRMLECGSKVDLVP